MSRKSRIFNTLRAAGIDRSLFRCCERIGDRTTYYTRGRKVSLCGKCLEKMLHAENNRASMAQDRPEGDDELSRLASYYHP